MVHENLYYQRKRGIVCIREKLFKRNVASMTLYIIQLIALVWVPLLGQFASIFLLGFMKDYCLKSF